MIAHGFEKYGSQEELEKDAIKHLYQVYVKVSADAATDPSVKVDAAKWFKRMEDGEEEALKNWRVWRELSVKKYEEEYQRLNVKFDVYLGESMVGKEWQDKALEKLEEMGLISDAKGKQLELVSKVDDETELTSDSKGAKLVDLEKWKLGKAVLRKAGK
jgi:arginyl-tRNA synthetase